MSSYIPAKLRRFVVRRANGRCEYCLIPQLVVFTPHEPDHIVAEQHGGKTEAENLAMACLRCNRRKGTNVGSYDPLTGELVAFFNPRTQVWQDHFALEGAFIQPLTPQARVTVNILDFNATDRLKERERAILLDLYL